MRLVHFADLHLDTPFRWASQDVSREWRNSLRQTLLRLCAYAVEVGADALTCGGDLYEQDRFTPDTAEFLRSTFADLDPLPVFLAPGNHDWFGPTSLYQQVPWSPNVHVFRSDRLEPVTIEDGFTLWGAAHRAPANTDGFLENFTVDRGGVSVGLFHGSAIGRLPFQEEGKVPHAPFHEGQISRAGLCHVLAGHFHTPYGSSALTYPGNPDPLSFGETGQRGTVLADISHTGQVIIERKSVETFAVHDISVDITGATHAGMVIEKVAARIAGLSGVVRVTVFGEVAPDIDLRLQDIAALKPAHLEALVPRLGVVHVAYDLDRLRKEPTVRGQFINDVLADTALSDEERARILTTGLRALDGRGDELEVH